MRFLRSLTFRTRLNLGLLLPLVLFEFLRITHEAHDHEKMFLDGLVRESEMAANLGAEALVLPLGMFDQQRIEEIAERILTKGSIAHVMVTDAEGEVLVERTDEGFAMGTEALQVSAEIRQPPAYGDLKLGAVTVVVPGSAINGPLKESLEHLLLVALIALFLFSGVAYFVVSFLSRPLSDLAKTVAALRDNELDGPVPDQDRRDELGLLARSLEQLRLGKIEMAELRAESDESARRENKRILRALQSTRDAVLLADENGQVVFCNPNAEAFFGNVRAGYRLNFRTWLTTELAEKAESHVLRKENFAFEANIVDSLSGEDLSLLVRSGPIRDEHGLYLGTLLLASDHSDQARQAEWARYLAEHDSLTGLPNRRLMEQTFQSWLQEEGEEVSILLADLDHFKLINDTLGHPAGDALLQVVAQKFKACASTHVLAARLGGDEFAILVKGASSLERLTNIAERLVIEMSQPQEINGQVLHTGMSAGIATLSGPDSKPSEGIRRADLALYEAKRAGRGTVEVFHEDLETEIKRKALLERELRHAIEQGDIRPVYQIQTDLKTGEIIGFETLARWHHRQLGTVSPAEFIPIAEDSGLIRELTRQMLLQAFKTTAKWHEMGFRGRVAVNLSPKLFGSRVDEFLNDCLYEANCPAEAVEAEITETVVLASGQSALTEIQALQELGVTVALDDFGMGYSSLSYLQKFPVDKIKVDSAFVSKLPESQETRAIVVAIAELGHALGMRVTGEGAETDEHRKLLKACKVDYLQGYYDGPPLAERAATARLFPSQAEHLNIAS